MESLKKDVHRPITILLWDYMTHHWVNVFDLGDNSTKKWVQKIHIGTFTYSDDCAGKQFSLGVDGLERF